MIGSEFGRGIGTGGHCQTVAVGIGVVEASHEGGQMRLLVVRVGSFPRTESAGLQVVVAEFICIEVGDCGIESGVCLLLEFRQCQRVEVMLLPAFLVGQHHVTQEGFHLFRAFVCLSVRPDGGGQVLGIFDYVIGISTEENQFQFVHQIESQTSVSTDMRGGVMILYFHPCQRIRDLTGGSDSVP